MKLNKRQCQKCNNELYLLENDNEKCICLQCIVTGEFNGQFEVEEKQIEAYNRLMATNYTIDTFSMACYRGEIDSETLKDFPILKYIHKEFNEFREEFDECITIPEEKTLEQRKKEHEDHVIEFYKKYPLVRTDIQTEWDGDVLIVKAKIYPDIKAGTATVGFNFSEKEE